MRISLKDSAKNTRDNLESLTFLLTVELEKSNKIELFLHDGSPNFNDFSQNRNNRFLTDEAASKNRLSKGNFTFLKFWGKISAVKNLHFYNAPSSVTLDELAHISSSFNINPPTKIRRFKEMQDKGTL